MISAIIPTLNEEKYLPLLLETLEKQKDIFEIIIIDGNSTDNTCGVVKTFQKNSKHHVKLITLEEAGLSKQRNIGVDSASFNQLLFLDADVVIADDFVNLALAQMKKRNISLAGTKIFAAESQLSYRLMYSIYSHFYLPFMRIFNPVLHGCSIFINKDLHYKIGGFDDDVTFEDFMYTKKASKHVKSYLLKRISVKTSARRYYNPLILSLVSDFNNFIHNLQLN